MPTDGSARARTLALFNQKGGVGKTTSTVNLAAALARLGRRVLVVDLDPQAQATTHLGVDPASIHPTLYDLLLDPAADPAPAAVPVAQRLWLLPGETSLAAAEIELAGAPDRHQRLRAVLNRLAGAHDVVLIDCPPSLGLLTLAGLAAADDVLIPMQAHFLALQGVGRLLETVQMVQSRLNPALRVAGVIVCMHDAGTTHAQEVLADLEAFFDAARALDVPWRGARVLRPLVRRNIKLAECPSFGKCVFDYAPAAAGAADYAALARALLDAIDLPAAEPEVVVMPAPRAVAGPAA
jgi:chromosome partitioning protein